MKISATGNYNSLFYLAAFFTFVIFIGLSLGGQSGLIQLWHLKKQKEALMTQNRILQNENLFLRIEQKSLDNPKTIEHLAREILGFSYPDEIVLITQEISTNE
ncbi:MAG: hypothetical protein A3G32_03240 [Deltaproteobacteria bacterium RIFCSPLOWO2_12_FULL_40_28]|nr:MAG: hypothetical protein A3C45_01925 [Deltaproteobacteria bacterium RIFCSPHIGHO2_02_FULL_40_28]OGQ20113.1 MAG: hypothetical protein A3E27_01220 [Deltaproteobacteria bacterium RIFCSPHIGHO2_12_FULL_40_32]OGQ40684.1 MAG: hypothetical protein A3I69_02485 [Deltaproteobacteria bacterium RIFCSPLOWO2_02_FULL_40_36]OGQ54379.1 MAG: hypothetical protein A3G32_03240 [Deltaproteobacteria bacterium RIFCSPLOWO2_12_FULL_40_28]